MNNIDRALDVAFAYAQIDGRHHKMWVIDQMVKQLLESEKTYNKWVKKYKEEGINDPNDFYEWDVGIAP